MKKQKKNNKFENILEYFVSSSIFLFIFVTAIIVLTSILFIVNISIFKLLLPIIFILSVIIYILCFKKKTIKEKIIPTVIGLLVFIFTTLVSAYIYDNTADGTTYHKLAVGAMKNGWNPVWQDVAKFNKDKGNPFDIYEDNVNTKWVNTYAKGSEIYGAVVYSFTNNIDAGKSFNMVFVYIALFVLYMILKGLKLKTWQALLVSSTMALNPISLTQLTNYYLDGVLSITLFIILLLIMNRKLLEDKVNYLLLGMSIIWACSVKFTGLAFAGVFCGILYFYNNYKYIKEEKKFLNKKTIRDTLFYIIVVSISILIVGSSSYTKNFVEHGHPLYPLYGKDHVDNMVLMEMPLSMQKDNNFMIFTKGIFSKSENSSPRYAAEHNEPDWKIPFTITKEELTNFVSPDLRIGGFGYFFGGVFILSIIGTVIYLYKFIKKKEYDSLITHLLVLGITFTLVFVLDGSYWARYIPYVYMIPIFVMINFMIIGNNKFYKVYPLVIMIFLLLDSILILGVQMYSTRLNNGYIKGNMYEFIESSKENEKVEIKLDHHGAQGVLYNLDDLNINNYVLVDELDSERPAYKFVY